MVDVIISIDLDRSDLRIESGFHVSGKAQALDAADRHCGKVVVAPHLDGIGTLAGVDEFAGRGLARSIEEEIVAGSRVEPIGTKTPAQNIGSVPYPDQIILASSSDSIVERCDALVEYEFDTECAAQPACVEGPSGE